MKTEANKLYRLVLWRMTIAHFNNKLIACVNTGITPCPKSSQSQSRPITNETGWVIAIRVSNSIRSFQWWIVKHVADGFCLLG